MEKEYLQNSPQISFKALQKEQRKESISTVARQQPGGLQGMGKYQKIPFSPEGRKLGMYRSMNCGGDFRDWNTAWRRRQGTAIFMGEKFRGRARTMGDLSSVKKTGKYALSGGLTGKTTDR